MTAKVETTEPWSNDFSKLVLEKCWKAKYTAINKEITAPSFVFLAKRIKMCKFFILINRVS